MLVQLGFDSTAVSKRINFLFCFVKINLLSHYVKKFFFMKKTAETDADSLSSLIR